MDDDALGYFLTSTMILSDVVYEVRDCFTSLGQVEGVGKVYRPCDTSPQNEGGQRAGVRLSTGWCGVT